MSRCQGAGLKIGREKVWTITYADDVALVTGSQEGLQGRLREMEIKWRGEKVEGVKEFLYLGYMMGRNNGDVSHIEYLASAQKRRQF